MLTRQPVGLFRAIKIIQAVVTDGKVSEDRGNVQRLAILQKFFVSLLIDLNGFLEAVLAEINVGEVAIQAREPQPVFVLVKNSARFLAQPEGPFILAVIDEALQRTADGPGVVN